MPGFPAEGFPKLEVETAEAYLCGIKSLAFEARKLSQM